MTSYKQGNYNFTLDDSKGCYVEVLHVESGEYAYFGVDLQGTDEFPYAWYHNDRHSTADGLSGGQQATSFDSALQRACQYLIHNYERKIAMERFDPKTVCEDMHARVKELEG